MLRVGERFDGQFLKICVNILSGVEIPEISFIGVFPGK